MTEKADYPKFIRALDADGGSYHNNTYLYAGNLTGIKPNSNDLLLGDKRKLLRLVEARSDLIDDITRSIGRDNRGLWYSHGYRSYILMFDEVDLPDSVIEDWRLAATKASLIRSVFENDISFSYCPDPAVRKVLDALDELIKSARKHGRIKED